MDEFCEIKSDRWRGEKPLSGPPETGQSESQTFKEPPHRQRIRAVWFSGTRLTHVAVDEPIVQSGTTTPPQGTHENGPGSCGGWVTEVTRPTTRGASNQEEASLLGSNKNDADNGFPVRVQHLQGCDHLLFSFPRISR